MEEMKAGRELDALIAEKVMGLPLRKEFIGDGSGGFFYPNLRPYSTDIEAAWEVVEKLKDKPEDGFTILFDKEEKRWRAGSLWWRGYEQAEWWEPKSAIADTPAHAICLAALKAVEI